MNERLQFLVAYVGSAALVAFVAACLGSPRVSTFTCDGEGAFGTQQCELVDTLAVQPVARVDMDAETVASRRVEADRAQPGS